MSNSTNSSTASTSITLHSLASHAKLRASQAAASRVLRRSFGFYLTLTLFTGPAAARELGKVYCDTSVDSLITLVFGALVGIGIPATMFYVGRSGLSYMRASGNPNQQNEARRDLILSVTGFGVILLAIVSPEIASKFFEQTSNSISPCVRPLG